MARPLTYTRNQLLGIINQRKTTKRLKIHFGAGTRIWPDHINLDMAPLKGIDIVHDLNSFPYPFEDNTFDEITANAVLEHMKDFVRAMEEIYRICVNGAVLKVNVPYWNSINVWVDPTHYRGFTWDTFTYFCSPSIRKYYANVRLNYGYQKRIPSTPGRFAPEPFRRWLSYFICNIYSSIEGEFTIRK